MSNSIQSPLSDLPTWVGGGDWLQEGVRVGMHIPGFQEGEWLSASSLDTLARAVRALVNCTVVEGDTNKATLSNSNFIIQVRRGGSGSGSGSLTKMTIVSHAAEHLVCTDADGGTHNVAKPQELRYSNTSTTIDSVEYSHGSYNTTTQQRVTTWGDPAQTETQVIQPRYLVGSEIWAESCSTGVIVSSTELLWLDANLAARAWARVYADKIYVGSMALSEGTSSGTVTGLGLATTPQEVFLQVANDLIIATPITPYTTDGFAFEMSGATTSADAKLAYMIYL